MSIPFGVLALLAGCAQSPSMPPMADAATPSRSMDGCGMMVNGQMVYKKLAPGQDCMNMEKPGGRMPNGVTMHSDPGY